MLKYEPSYSLTMGVMFTAIMCGLANAYSSNYNNTENGSICL